MNKIALYNLQGGGNRAVSMCRKEGIVAFVCNTPAQLYPSMPASMHSGLT